MNITIPDKVLRNIISNVLLERSYIEDQNAEEMALEEIRDHGIVLNSSCELGWNACASRIQADEVRFGEVSIEEAMKSLNRFELESVKKKALEWYKENNQNNEIKRTK